ncbi:MAG: hypothetical protein IT444_02615 [Phycisphaeraceae bacterium]|nr:hypothetical protein [Phycisphaeraceae bacterium]
MSEPNDTQKRNDFEQQAQQESPGIIRELTDFLVNSTSWWLIPIVVVLLLVGVLVVLGGSGLAPFIYTLF